ncbi:MAG: hypothetical protein R3246_13225 [Acidimicrobiia bacterium]|nr:hypothetical protein [Acidimicrobiia bacterium]
MTDRLDPNEDVLAIRRRLDMARRPAGTRVEVVWADEVDRWKLGRHDRGPGIFPDFTLSVAEDVAAGMIRLEYLDGRVEDIAIGEEPDDGN